MSNEFGANKGLLDSSGQVRSAAELVAASKQEDEDVNFAPESSRKKLVQLKNKTRLANKQSNKQVQVLPRRKWSEWSECTESCVRTRHRLNCDDLLLAQNGSSTAKESAVKIRLRRRRQIASEKNGLDPSGQLVRILRWAEASHGAQLGASSTESGQQRLLLAANSQDDDQDYADEGDEEDENDSCSKVETSKTFVEQACTGGLCKQPEVAPTQTQNRNRPPLNTKVCFCGLLEDLVEGLRRTLKDTATIRQFKEAKVRQTSLKAFAQLHSPNE